MVSTIFPFVSVTGTGRFPCRRMCVARRFYLLADFEFIAREERKRNDGRIVGCVF